MRPYGHSPMEDLVEAQRLVNKERARRVAAAEPVLTEYEVERILRRLDVSDEFTDT